MENKKIKKTKKKTGSIDAPTKYKKMRFVFWSDLSSAVSIKNVCPDLKPVIRTVKGRESADGKISLNVFDYEGEIKIDDIKYIYVTVSETVLLRINTKGYRYKDNKVKVVGTSRCKNGGLTKKKIRIPIEVMSVLIREKNLIQYNDKELYQGKFQNRLINIFNYVFGEKSVELVGKNNKHLAYMLVTVD